VVLRRGKDEFVEFLVAVNRDDPHTSLVLVLQVPLVLRYELVPPWDFADRLARIDVLHHGLNERDSGQGFGLAWRGGLVRAESLEADVLWIEKGWRAKCAHHEEPGVFAKLGRKQYVGGWVRSVGRSDGDGGGIGAAVFSICSQMWIGEVVIAIWARTYAYGEKKYVG
jgi:hypothetical protein